MKPDKFRKTIEYFAGAFEDDNKNNFKRNVVKRIIERINIGELNEKRRIIGTPGLKKIQSE